MNRTRNAECTGCGWKGDRFPPVKMTRWVPLTLLPGSRAVFTDKYIAAIAKKPCPACGGVVAPIPTKDVGWP